jgi:hypothetical protein
MTLPAAPSNVHATANFTTAATPTPYVVLYWDNDRTVDNYRISRGLLAPGQTSSQIATVNSLQSAIPTLAYEDDGPLVPGDSYVYEVQAIRNSQSGPGTLCTVGVPLYPQGFNPAPPADISGSLNRWTFTDVYQKGPSPYTYAMTINPNDGGSPTFDKSVVPLRVTGPNEMPILQEGSPGMAVMTFSGIILSQAQLEAMEIWFRKRILLMVQDDLGRRFYGVFSRWVPKRTRRASNAWYHTYDADLSLTAYYNASGQRIFGRFL